MHWLGFDITLSQNAAMGMAIAMVADVGNVKNDVIREGSGSYSDSGRPVGNVKKHNKCYCLFLSLIEVKI